MELRFGRSFGHVRAHTDADSARRAQRLGARAFTHGPDIYFGRGRYRPGTASGERLIAHELAHVVQSEAREIEATSSVSALESEARAAASNVTAGRSVGAIRGRATPDVMPLLDGEGITQEGRQQLTYAMTVLPRAPLTEAEQDQLERLIPGSHIYELISERSAVQQEIETKEAWLTDYRSRNAALERGEELSAGVGAGPELLSRLESERQALMDRSGELTAEINAELEALGISSERELVRMVRVEFPRMWIAQAKEIALGMLSVNRERVLAEQERSPPDMCTIDTAKLQAADAELYDLEQQRQEHEATVSRLEEERQQATTHLEDAQQLAYDAAQPGGLPGGVGPSLEDLQALQGEIDRINQQLETAETELSSAQAALQDKKRTYSTDFPLLAIPQYYPGVFARASEEGVSRITGRWTEDILENIEETEENIIDDDLKVWDLNVVPALTYLQMGVDPEGPLGQAVRTYIADEESDESILDIALAAFEVGAVIAATILTAPAGGWGGLVVGGLFTAGHIYTGIQGYMAEQSASQVAMDPAVADISRHEPELFWIVVDIASLGLDIGPIVRALRPAARALMITRDIRVFAEEAAHVAPEAAESLVRSARRRLGIAVHEADEAMEVITAQTRHVRVNRPDLLARYERLSTEKMPEIVRDVLSRQRSTPTRRRLGELFDHFETLRTSTAGRSLTEAERAQAMDILREARDLARADFANVRDSVWRRLRRDPELSDIADQMVAAGDAQLGGRSGTVRISTRWDDSREGFQALEIEHRTRLSDNPWRYNDPTNLLLTDSPQNQQMLEAIRREGGIWPAGDEIEDFIISHGLLDQSNVGAPRAR
jgi:hypothetical protein